jgi:predicted nucleic-acid-binding protein
VIGIDTNVLLRHLLQDDPVQSRQAGTVIASLNAASPGWIAQATMLELVWTLESKNRSARHAIADSLEHILGQEFVTVENAEVIAEAVQCFREPRADFGDCVIAAAARAAGCKKVVTFDAIAARHAGMELIEA